MKTINFELSKRLSEWWYLDNLNTEKAFYFQEDKESWVFFIEWNWLYIWNYKNTIKFKNVDWEPIEWDKLITKTLTLEEAIELLPSGTRIIMDIQSDWTKQYIWNNIEWLFNNLYFQYNTLIELIENMLEYLLDNNLLNNEQ